MVALVGAVALLAVNAATTLLGWSPFESMVQEQIRKQSHIAEATSVEKRNQLRNTSVTVKTGEQQQERKNARQRHHHTIEQQGISTTKPEVQQAKEAVMMAPVAPAKPQAPQRSPRPAAPTPPSYIFYYPDGSRHYVYQLVDPQTAPYSE